MTISCERLNIFGVSRKTTTRKARQWAEKAIALDPKFSDAYAFAGGILLVDVLFRWSENPQADLQRSFELAQKALALDDSNSMPSRP